MLTEQQKKEGHAAPLSTTSAALEQQIAGAIKKVNGRKENDLCRYLPMSSGGYMHHFTLRKMKYQLPEKLSEMIRRYIIEVEKPLTVKPKQRAARGSKKKKDHVILQDNDIESLRQLARAAGNRELLKKLMPRKELKVIKRELISSVRKGIVEPTLWSNYVEALAQY